MSSTISRGPPACGSSGRSWTVSATRTVWPACGTGGARVPQRRLPKPCGETGAPNNRLSGGRVPGRRSPPSAHRAAAALRLAAQSLHHSKSALGAFLRRLAAQKGMAKAITATAYKLARIIYSMLTAGSAFVERGQDYYEQNYRDRVLKNLKRRAHDLGYS